MQERTVFLVEMAEMEHQVNIFFQIFLLKNINSYSNFIPGEKGEKGEQGPKGEKGLPGNRTFSALSIQSWSTTLTVKHILGLTGPRGKLGKAGIDGTPGQPGISARNCSVNGTNKLLIPPAIVGIKIQIKNFTLWRLRMDSFPENWKFCTIIGSEPAYYSRNVSAEENIPLKIKCLSTGVPQPVNSWRRIEEGEQVPIPQGQWGGR